MQQVFDKTDKSVNTLNTGVSKLASTLRSFIAASVLKNIAGMVQDYQEMAERVKMATSSQDEFEHVQKRLLDTANGTYRVFPLPAGINPEVTGLLAPQPTFPTSPSAAE